MNNDRELLQRVSAAWPHIGGMVLNDAQRSVLMDIAAALTREQEANPVGWYEVFSDGKRGMLQWGVPSREYVQSLRADGSTIGYVFAREQEAQPSQPLLLQLDYAIEHGWPLESRSLLAGIRARDIRVGVVKAAQPAPERMDDLRALSAMALNPPTREEAEAEDVSDVDPAPLFAKMDALRATQPTCCRSVPCKHPGVGPCDLAAPSCFCGEPSTPGVFHRDYAPCYVLEKLEAQPAPDTKYGTEQYMLGFNDAKAQARAAQPAAQEPINNTGPKE